ncbi:MAG TPA: LysM peptidoglycan-binding domain-containing protein [Actinomycetota bacterium]|nr:LysM peptidoglycan-binding domain-containing protein [Actinomycetota bacterium]
MRLRRYRGKHLKARARGHAPAAVGTATVVWLAGGSAQAGTHVVRAGETLSSIAARYRTTVTALARANDIADPDFVVAGTRLRVRTPALRHRVRPGETLSAIASRFGTTVAALARANKLADPNLILPGQSLRVPGGMPVSAAATTSAALPSTPPAVPVAVVEESLERQSAAHGVRPSLVKAVAMKESAWRQDAVSSAGAVGVMQVMPDTADFVNEVLDPGPELDLRDADDNVHLGVMYLDHLLDGMPTERDALAAYYSGPGNVGARLDRAQRGYAADVKDLEAEL